MAAKPVRGMSRRPPAMNFAASCRRSAEAGAGYCIHVMAMCAQQPA